MYMYVDDTCATFGIVLSNESLCARLSEASHTEVAAANREDHQPAGVKSQGHVFESFICRKSGEQ